MSYGREGKRPNIVQGASWSMHDHVQCFHKNLSQVPPTYFFGVGASAIPLVAAIPAQSIKIDTLKLNLIGDYREIKVAKH